MKVFTFLTLFILLSTEILAQKSIGIFTCHTGEIRQYNGMNVWDPDSIKSGITGSEEAVIYMSQKLADLGYRVIVFGNPPENSVHTLPEANPRFVTIDQDDGSLLNIAISWRMPSEGAKLKSRAQKVYLWPHDVVYFFLTGVQINDFDNVLWLSEWQRQQWMALNPSLARFNKIFGNGINPEQFMPVQERVNPHACIYSSNYGGGLEILLDIWPTIKQRFPKATLDIYYGWQSWGFLSAEKEASMRAQLASLASLGVCDHGLVGHEELNRAYEKASLWTYPCIRWETFCITALRAQFAGALPVIIEGSALKETVQNGFKCLAQDEYCDKLIEAMSYAETITLNDRNEMRRFILNAFTWEVLAMKWKTLFEKQEKDQTWNGPDEMITFLLVEE